MPRSSHVFASILSLAGFSSAPAPAASCPDPKTSVSSAPLFTDFTRTSDGGRSLLDHCDWEVVTSNWGGTTDAGDYSGGVVAGNVTWTPAGLVLKGHGNHYTGPILGRGSDGVLRADGKRTGAALRSRRRFQGGRFEACVTIPEALGVVTAFWTFRYEEGGGAPPRNHEIDIEFPGQPDAATPVDLDHVNLTTWRDLGENGHTTLFKRLSSRAADGKFHLLRFDWIPPTSNSEGLVRFYIDHQPQGDIATTVPSLPGEVWFGLWFPPVWAGTPDFDEVEMRVKWVRAGAPFDGDAARHDGPSCE